jgi:hypothetical protein
MRSLSDEDLVEVWEEGFQQHPLERPLTLLGRARPELGPGELAIRPLGQLNAALLHLYHETFGSKLEGTADCPACSTRLEFRAETESLLGPVSGTPRESVVVEEAATRIEARLPTLADLAAAAACEEMEAARRTIITRCVHRVTRAGEPLEPADLPAAVLDRVAQELAMADPGAEILFQLNCGQCGHAWSLALDPAEFIWTHLNATVRRLLLEVHTLASAYGWSETEVLRLGPVRRMAYLEMAGAP